MSQRMPSLDLVLGSFDRERDRDLAHFDSLDTKAGVVLGFSGVLVALVGRQAEMMSIISSLLAAAAALLALSAFWPRKLPALELGRLRDYLTSEQAITKLAMIDTYLQMMEDGRLMTRGKARRLKTAMTLLTAATAVASASMLGG